MTDLVTLFPRKAVSELQVPLAGGGMFDLVTEKPEHFSLVVFYRGLRGPICELQLTDLQRKLPDFAQRGVGVLAISSDDEARAAETRTGWGLDSLRLGYWLDMATARQ